MKTKDWILNAIIAALYVVVTGILVPISFGAWQFRVGEMLNHLAVFHKKYIVGIVAGVFISNLFFSEFGAYDLLFGVGHSILSLLLMLFFTRNQHNPRTKMIINTLMFAVMSFLVAWELNIVVAAPFWFTYLTVAVGELVVMSLGIPLMEYLDKRLHFSNAMK